MAAKLAVDDKLIEEALTIRKHATKKVLVNEGPSEYIQRRKQGKIISLFNSIEYDPDYGYKAQRKKRCGPD